MYIDSLNQSKLKAAVFRKTKDSLEAETVFRGSYPKRSKQERKQSMHRIAINVKWLSGSSYWNLTYLFTYVNNKVVIRR